MGKKQDIQKGLHAEKTQRRTEARQKWRIGEWKEGAWEERITDTGRQNGRAPDNERAEQNVQELNIRKRILTEPATQQEQQQQVRICTVPVSYTHLTLPTILRVYT